MFQTKKRLIMCFNLIMFFTFKSCSLRLNNNIKMHLRLLLGISKQFRNQASCTI